MAMTKKFLDTFPTLKLSKQQQEYFEPVEVTRVVSAKKKDYLRIYIYSERLIPKETVFAVERQIEKQILSQFSMQVKMYEQYRLSAQYNVPKLMDAYLDSILFEIREYDHILHNILRKAQISYPDEKTMCLNVEDTVLAREKMPELVRILEKIIGDRCGLDVVIKEEYREPKETSREEEELWIKRQVDEIIERISQTPAEKVEKQSEEKKKEEGNRPQKEEYRRPVKKSDNPDVIYGRDFDGETIRIDEIIGEIGEVTIR